MSTAADEHGFKINFVLHNIDDIAPFGENRDHLSWFGLTDADLWIDAGASTIYEYSEAAVKAWGASGVNDRYNDYYLSRFLEDFSRIFGAVGESVPRRLYDAAENFADMTRRWMDLRFPDDDNDEDDGFDEFFDGEFQPLNEWYGSRVIDSGHLTGGPGIGFVRCGGRLKIFWKSDHLLEGGESIWTAPSGVFELSYEDFVCEARRFFGEFFQKMDEQVQKALRKDWGGVRLDKEYLARENKERKEGFEQKLSLLDGDRLMPDGSAVEERFEKMLSQIGDLGNIGM